MGTLATIFSAYARKMWAAIIMPGISTAFFDMVAPFGLKPGMTLSVAVTMILTGLATYIIPNKA